MHSSGEGDVRKTEELDTIDGVEPREDAAERPTSRPTPLPDYDELMPVDRRHYAINGEIAKGGMGRVLDARDLRLGRAVAIKELLPRNRDLARRFEREARITAGLQHPAIIHIYEAGVWIGGEPFYAMAKVSGRSLDKVIEEKKTLNERLGLLPNVIAVAEALAYAHNAGVIHRDLKPANVLVGEFGQTVVIDWGLAKDLAGPEESGASLKFESVTGETTIGSVVGTPTYMPPEQARGESVDQRADVYAIGALLYEALVGKPPYVGVTHKEVIERVRTEAPPPIRELEPGAPLDLVAIVEKAMDRDPMHRYGDAGELAKDLRRFETGQLVAAHHYTTSQLTWRWLRKHRVAVAISAFAVVALAIVGTLSLGRIVEAKRTLARNRSWLHEDRGRHDLLEGRVGEALVNFSAAAVSGDAVSSSLGFMMAEAARSFEAQVSSTTVSRPDRVAVAYAPKGELVAAVGDGPIHLWGRNKELVFGRNLTRTRVIAFDSTGAHLLTAGADGIARIWTIEGAMSRELKGHAAAILDATFSPDDRYVATASADGTARVWDISTGAWSPLPDDVRQPRPWSCSGAPIVSIRFSPDGSRVAAAVGTSGCVWDEPAKGWGKQEGTFVSPLLAHTAAIKSIRWSLDGARLATASADGTARVWPKPASSVDDAGAVKPVMAPVGREGGPAIASVEWSVDGKQLLVADADHLARIVTLPETAGLSAKPEDEIRFEGHTAGLSGAVFSPDGTMIATAGLDSSARVWDAATGTLILSLESAGTVEALAFSPSNQYLVTGSRDGTARVWDLSKRADRVSLPTDSPVHAIAVSADGKLALGRDDSYVIVRNGDASTRLENGLGRITATQWSPDGSLLVAGEDGKVRVWTRKLGLQYELSTDHVRSAAYSRDGTLIATASDEGYVRLWHASNGRAVQPALARHPNKLTNVAFGPNRLIAALDEKGQLILWDRDLPYPLERFQVTAAAGVALAFSRDGRRIVVSSSTDTIIREIDGFMLGPRVVELERPTGDVRAVAFSVDDARIVTAGDGKVRIWDAATGKRIWTRDAPGVELQSLALSPDGNTLWAAGKTTTKGIVRGWDIRASIDAKELERALEHDPWELDEDDDVVRLKVNPHEQR